jgi:hypothetical protein
MSRVAIRAAMNRTVKETDPDEIGVDVARFGGDNTEMYRRHGAKVIGHREYRKQDTQFIAEAAWDFAGRDYKVAIKVDEGGLGAGVVDRLRALGAQVVPVNFGGLPVDKKKYTTAADEMYFELPIDEIQIPDDPQLMKELSGRLYGYDKIGRRKIESKDDYKKRFGKSPDKADGLVLCFYRPHRGGGVTIARTKGL